MNMLRKEVKECQIFTKKLLLTFSQSFDILSLKNL